MGNDLCSQANTLCNPQDSGLAIYEYPAISQPTARKRKPSKEATKEPPIIVPVVNREIKLVLTEKKELMLQLTQRQGMLKKKQFGNDVYEGEVQGNIPHGFGSMYKADGSLFIGRFQYGRAEGTGLYVLPDGSYFQGGLTDNRADCEHGKYVSCQLTYEGGFKNNLFSGQGKEKSKKHSFQGTYVDGVKRFGELHWGDGQHSFYGKFDAEGLFTEDGVLQEPTGKYTGCFLRGKKHGDGTYLYNNGIQYQGEYVNGVKQGRGTVKLAKTGALIYQGQFKNGLPDGRGFKYEENGSKAETLFKEGINVLTLINPQVLS